MNSTLKMLLPTTLPIAMSVLPSSTAPTDTATSGALVPKATMVRPTTSGEMPKDSASLDAPRTSSSAPATSAARPAMNSSRVIQCSPPPRLPGAISRSVAAMASADSRKVTWISVCHSSTFSL